MMGGAWREYERTKESASRAGQCFALAGAATFALLTIHHFFWRDGLNADSVPVAVSGDVTQSELVDFPGTTSAVESSPEPIVAPGHRAYGRDGTTYVGIYECKVNGERVVSDRPCGAGATTRVIQVAPATAPAPSVPQYRPTQPSTGSRRATNTARSANAAPDNTSACAAVDRAIDDLNARMRQQYGSSEGEWLRERWHRLKRQRYDLRCGR